VEALELPHDAQLPLVLSAPSIVPVSESRLTMSEGLQLETVKIWPWTCCALAVRWQVNAAATVMASVISVRIKDLLFRSGVGGHKAASFMTSAEPADLDEMLAHARNSVFSR
jgi:hypothetical protein